jgi:hypothetical protein
LSLRARRSVWCLLILGGMHFFNMYVLARMRSRRQPDPEGFLG